MDIIDTTYIPIEKIRENRGQVPGLPKNPRCISLSRLRKLEQSLRDYPHMLTLRELIVIEHEGFYVIVCGNMRFRAARLIGYTEIPCKILPATTPIDDVRAYALRDNSHFGEWQLMDIDFTRTELDLALVPVDYRIPATPQPYVETYTIKSPEKPKVALSPYMGTSTKYTDLIPRPALYLRDEFSFTSIFRTSKQGIPIEEAKTAEHFALFANETEKALRKSLRLRNPQGWAIVTPPCRRHTESNFSESVCRDLSARLEIPFREGFCTAKNRDRIQPVFLPNYELEENNVILFDDIITTGTTIRAMLDLMPRKNVVVVIGIYNL